MIKYKDALKKYNEGSDKWCMPRKGSEDYVKIRGMMNKISQISQISNIKMKDKLDLFNVSGRNNNCFFNSIYLLLKEKTSFKLKSGSELRKYLCNKILQKANLNKTIKKFITYLELVKFYINDGEKNPEIARLLSVNIEEIRSLRKANIKKINLNNNNEIEALLETHLKISGRMPSGPEMSLAIDYIKNKYNIVVLRIILNSGKDKTLDIMNSYYKNKSDVNLRKHMKTEIISKVRRRIGEKLENVMKATGSSLLLHHVNNYNYGVIITDNTHYQMLKINNKVLNSLTDLSNFIASEDNSFSFSKTDVRNSS